MTSLYLYQPPVNLFLPYSLSKTTNHEFPIVTESPLESQASHKKLKFDQKGHYCLDGFPNPDKNCVVVLPAPERKGYPFVGIKTSVLIVDENADKPLQKPVEQDPPTVDFSPAKEDQTIPDSPKESIRIDNVRTSEEPEVKNYEKKAPILSTTSFKRCNTTSVQGMGRTLTYPSAFKYRKPYDA